MLGPDELQKRFYPQFLRPSGLAQLEYVRSTFLELATNLVRLLPDGPEKNITMDQLQASSMWAIKAVCVNPEYWSKNETKKAPPKRGVGFRFLPDGWHIIYNDGSTGEPLNSGMLEELALAFQAMRTGFVETEFDAVQHGKEIADNLERVRNEQLGKES